MGPRLNGSEGGSSRSLCLELVSLTISSEGQGQRRSTHDHEGTVVSAPGPILLGRNGYVAKNQLGANVCTADGQFIVAIARNLTRPALNLSSLYVKDGQEAECRPKLITEELVAFRFPITSCGSTQRYPIERILRESVFVEVRVKDRTDPMIVLRLHDCWATPVPAPDHEEQWSLLVDGCPYEGDDYLTVLHPVDASSGLQFPAHHKRFEVKTFVFLDGVSEQPLSGQVYLHCSAEVCSPSALDDCTTRCGPSEFLDAFC
ncbi:zona pellucida sperm-binding protein 4-like [Stegostoma tigrinum]|uniref:zona pellucida sperm-binding protein 4-like n=1 Tax=Stegostoma tigrinum TaxID=3053191 RepID=UPI00286FF38B|nr:zona pellucida sperm-binding protein 4-like [Stegostoma tigrinum]